MARIRLLPEEVYSRIAAGEVVERPASVVKELVENALDAGARRIEVDLSGGGLTLIRVHDDGEGMSPEDLRLCWHPHATSKISQLEDLQRLCTFGFRGEALHSIARVSRLTILSRPRDRDEAHLLRVHFGREEEFRPAPGSPGTTVTVEDLFREMPARKAFLRSPRAEAGRVLEILRLMALCAPETSFRLTQEKKEVFRWPGGSRKALLSRILGVSEKDLQEKILERKPYRIHLLLTRPEVALGTTRYLFLLVNDRAVKDRTLLSALLEGARAFFPGGRFPAGVLSLYLPPHLVDVNVHPAKWEVRFREEREIYALVRRAVEGVFSRPFPVSPDSSRPYPSETLRQEPPEAPAPISGQVAEPQSPGFSEGPWPEERFLGFLGKTYALFETREGLLLLDFHAAHERLLYEGLCREAPESETLLFPAVFEISEEARERLEELGEEIRRSGFRFREVGPREIMVEGVPRGGGFAAVEELRALLEERPGGPGIREQLAARLACRLARKAGDQLSPQEALHLLRRIRQEGLSRCPHGRPLYLLFSWDELEKRFGRKV